MESLEVALFAAAQEAWLAVRALGRALLGRERFDRLIDRTGLRGLKNRAWLSRRMLPDGSDLLYRPHDQCIIEEVYGRDAYGRDRIPAGATVVDAGAHIGVFTLMAARRVGPSGRVFAFEPSPGSRKILERNVRCNGLSWVSVIPAALADAPGTASFYAADASAANPVADSLDPVPGREPVSVPVLRLDDALAREGVSRVDLLKVDVEGAELKLIDGAPRTLAGVRRVVMEVHPPRVDPEEVRQRLDAQGFSCRISEAGGCVLLEAVRP
ncbi:MAG: FkbM family methyltransferase [Elusimicrobia bacterium]|nr:FkbM family methyltransferase [Elusimicrobiota bacterium]